jgi:D-glycero-beta-D-manno-heptose-7-phosphate kinase
VSDNGIRPGAGESLRQLIARLAGHHILVVGDVFLDEYLIGRADRLSREAPVPVLEFERRDLIPGGAANPALNVVSLGSQSTQVGVVGDDDAAATLCDMLRSRGIHPDGLIADPGRPTTTKTRIMAHMGLRFPQQVARIDRIDRRPISGATEQAILGCLQSLVERANAIMVSDYLTGLLTTPVVDAIRDISYHRGLLITADAQGSLGKYAGFDLVKCNADEAMRHVQRDLKTNKDFAEAGLSIVAELELRGAMLITRGPDGATVAQRSQNVAHLQAPRIEDVYDTVGAGDTVLAVVTLAMVAGASYEDAAALANLAAGIVVRRVGNYAPSPDELRSEIGLD